MSVPYWILLALFAVLTSTAYRFGSHPGWSVLQALLLGLPAALLDCDYQRAEAVCQRRGWFVMPLWLIRVQLAVVVGFGSVVLWDLRGGICWLLFWVGGVR